MDRYTKLLLVSLASLVLTPVLYSETGGLQSLAFPLGDEIERSSVNLVTNGNFADDGTWAYGVGHAYSAEVTRTADGSGSLAITRNGTETLTSQDVSLGEYRVLRIRAWLRASGGDPGATATFRIYMYANGSVVQCGSQFNLSGLSTVEWTEYSAQVGGNCNYFHTRPEIQDSSISFRLYGANIANGVTVYVDDVSLTPIVRPLVVFPTYPNYRGMLWPDQGTTLKWNAVVDVPDGETLEGLTARVQIVAADGSTVVDTVTDSSLEALRTTGGWRGYSVTPMTYDASGLADGVYYLRGTLRRTSGDVLLYTYPDYKIVKEQPSVQRDTWKSWVDRYNRLVLNGKPVFGWGGYARFTASRNTFSASGTGISGPNYYRGLANGCNSSGGCSTASATTVPWAKSWGEGGATWLKQFGDIGANVMTIYADYGTVAKGLNASAATGSGSISTDGVDVTGSGTSFGTEILPAPTGGQGDVIRVSYEGTGTASAASGDITGSGTAFLTEVEPGDEICPAVGVCRYIRGVLSDTLLSHGSSSVTWTGQSFTIRKHRKVVTTPSATSATIHAPFPSNLSSASYQYFRCATDGPRWTSADAIANLTTALQDYGIWYWQLTSNIIGAATGTGKSDYSTYYATAPYHGPCNLVTRDDATRWITRFKPLGLTSGFLGYYMADEPDYSNPAKGLEAVWDTYRGHRDANMGGVSFWVDGAVPRHAFDQWNQITDMISPDPYPASGELLPNPDDGAYGLTTWNKHGRSWNWPRRPMRAVFDSRPVFTSIQLFTWFGSGGYPYSTFPQVSDMKIQAVSAIAAGSSGVWWWQTGSASGGIGDHQSAGYAAWRYVSKYIQRHLPILETPILDFPDREDGEAEYGRVLASVSDAAIKCSSRRRGTQVLVACANTTDTDKTVTITMTDTIPGKVNVPWTGATVTPDGASFEYTFKGVNGGTYTSGSGTITVTSGGVGVGNLVCASGDCAFDSVFGPLRQYRMPTIKSNGITRLAWARSSSTAYTVSNGMTGVTNLTWSYSLDEDKDAAAEIFIIDTAGPAAGGAKTASN